MTTSGTALTGEAHQLEVTALLAQARRFMKTSGTALPGEAHQLGATALQLHRHVDS